jgi:hypothetical protein
MRRPTTILFLVVLLGLLFHRGPVLALQVLEPGYAVETYAAYKFEGPKNAPEPRGLVFDRHWNLYLSQWEHYPDKGSLFRVTIDRNAGKWIDSFGTPRRLIWTGGTNFGDYLYLADATIGKVLRIDLDGSVSHFSDVPGRPNSLALDITGNYGGHLYAASRYPDGIYSISDTGRAQRFSTFPGSVAGGHTDLTFDPGTDYGGHMYVTILRGQRPRQLMAGGGVFRIYPDGKGEKFVHDAVAAWSVQIDPFGLFGRKLLFAGVRELNQRRFSIWRADTDGSMTKFAVPTIGNDLLTFAFGSHGDLYVPEYSSETRMIVISRITPATRP